MCVNEDDLFEDLVTDTFSCPFLFVVVFSFLLVIMFFVFLLCNIARAGLDLAGGGVRRDLRVQSYHVFYLIVSLRFTVVSGF